MHAAGQRKTGDQQEVMRLLIGAPAYGCLDHLQDCAGNNRHTEGALRVARPRLVAPEVAA